MKRIKLMLSTALVAVMALSVASCSEESTFEPEPTVTIPHDVIMVDYDVDQGSLSQEYYKQILDQISLLYRNDGKTKDVSEYLDSSIIPPMQEKVNEVAAASGCYDFSVTILAYYEKDPDTYIYKHTIKPQK